MKTIETNTQKKGAAPTKNSAQKMYNKVNIANSDRLSNSFLVGLSLGSIVDHSIRERLIIEFLEPSVQITMSYFEFSAFFDGLIKALIRGGYNE